eukprot:866690-Pyramimonas_sp.AAC.1
MIESALDVALGEHKTVVAIDAGPRAGRGKPRGWRRRKAAVGQPSVEREPEHAAGLHREEQT